MGNIAKPNYVVSISRDIGAKEKRQMKDHSKEKRPELLLILIHGTFIEENPKGYQMEGERDTSTRK